MLTCTLYSQDHFDAQSIHPACRAGIPRPAAAPNIRHAAIHICSDHIGLHPVALHLLGCVRMIDGIDQAEEFCSTVTLPHLREGPDGPQRGMSVLTAILADAARVALDIAGVTRCALEG